MKLQNSYNFVVFWVQVKALSMQVFYHCYIPSLKTTGNRVAQDCTFSRPIIRNALKLDSSLSLGNSLVKLAVTKL